MLFIVLNYRNKRVGGKWAIADFLNHEPSAYTVFEVPLWDYLAAKAAGDGERQSFAASAILSTTQLLAAKRALSEVGEVQEYFIVLPSLWHGNELRTILLR